MFLSNTFEDGKRNLEVYFLTNNNKELNKAYELYTDQYGDQELVSAFEYADKKTGKKYIYMLLKDTLTPNKSYSYRITELPYEWVLYLYSFTHIYLCLKIIRD